MNPLDLSASKNDDDFELFGETITDKLDDIFYKLAVLKDTSPLSEFLKFINVWRDKKLSKKQAAWYEAFYRILSNPSYCTLTGSAPLSEFIKNATGKTMSVGDFDIFFDVYSLPDLIDEFGLRETYLEKYADVLKTPKNEFYQFYRHDLLFTMFIEVHFLNPNMLNGMFYDYIMGNQEYFPELGIDEKMSPEDIIKQKHLSVLKTSHLSSAKEDYGALASGETDIITFRSAQHFIPINIIIPVINVNSLVPVEYLYASQTPVIPFAPKTHLYNIAEKFDFENVKVYWDFNDKKVKPIYDIYLDEIQSNFEQLDKAGAELIKKHNLSKYAVNLFKAKIKQRLTRVKDALELFEKTVLVNPMDLKLSYKAKARAQQLFSRVKDFAYFYNKKDTPKLSKNLERGLNVHRMYSQNITQTTITFLSQTWPRINKYIERGFEFKDDDGMLDAISLYLEILPLLIEEDPTAKSIRRLNILRQSPNSIIYRDVREKFNIHN